MKILLVNPETPATFWSFKNAIGFISKKASNVPLGLLTVAALLPPEWEKRLVDMDAGPLRDRDILWADYVFLGGMDVQIRSFKRVAERSRALGRKVAAGGPMVTMNHDQISGVDYFILNEAEITLPQFINDLQKGEPKPIYRSDRFPEISETPVPMWSLLNMKKYAGMNLQYSRGCPFNCEFCTITMLNGHTPRTKTKEQLISELDALYNQGWRGNVFIVDDNFIGNKRKLKTEILPAMVEWSMERDYPFQFTTEASINLADDEELLHLMVRAGFRDAFIGIETPNDESLSECGKSQNRNRDMVSSVKKMQRCGLVVSGGFIVGFDHDPPSIFEQQIRFIQQSGIVTAMVGLLNAPTGSRLFQRLKDENRLLKIMSGDNMDGSINFIPKMKTQQLLQGYKQILTTIYSQKEYYERVRTFLREYQLPRFNPQRIAFQAVSYTHLTLPTN